MASPAIPQHIRYLVIALAMALCVPGTAGAQSLVEALSRAYMENPDLSAARAALRVTDEALPQARSGLLPTVSASGSYARTRNDIAGSERYSTPKSVQLDVTQPLFRGGRTFAAIDRAQNQIKAQRAVLHSAEQDVLLSAATAYFDVIRDFAVVRLNTNNENVLARQLEASQDRFRVGEITRTDVSQSESRLAGAVASRVQAEGQLRSSRAVFERVIGMMPGEDLTNPEITFILPESLEATLAQAKADNPNIASARYLEQAARDGVDVVFGELLPTLNLVASMQRSYDQGGSFFTGDSETDSVSARLTIPLYQSGQVSSRVRQAKQTASQRLLELESTERQVRQLAVSSWESLVSARAALEAIDAQVESAEIALEGVRQEAQVGSRTTLDILDAEQELLNAQVSRVRTKRDELVAVFSLLSVLGRLTADWLELPVDSYNPNAYYERVDWKIWGTGTGD